MREHVAVRWYMLDVTLAASGVNVPRTRLPRIIVYQSRKCRRLFTTSSGWGDETRSHFPLVATRRTTREKLASNHGRVIARATADRYTHGGGEEIRTHTLHIHTARAHTHHTHQRDIHAFGDRGDKSVAGLRPGEKTSRDVQAIADGDESFPLNGLPRVDLHLFSTEEAG